ncbi:MAG: DNA polymerase IV [Lachnospiraceae bacterium]|nr:DNA polymerase IV [Lachnospiraceae bacterium]
MGRLIFHVDVNSAFLSWEAARRVRAGEPDLRLIPSCVGGDPESRRSIVVAKSIPAKKYNIQTGEPVSQALRKCPGLVVVPSDFKLYSSCSKAFKDICRSYAPVVEEFSIDECFLDMTGTELVYPDPVATAYEIKDKIRDELGFTVNIGIGNNKLCAKMASDFEKPDKVHTLFPDEIQEKMWPLPVGDLLFIGKSTVKKLTEMNIRTIGELALSDPGRLADALGNKMSLQAYRYANGLDDSPVAVQPEEAKGYSNEVTLENDVTEDEVAHKILLALSDSVTEHMRRDGAKAHCVSVSIRYLDFHTRSHQTTLENAVDTCNEVYETAQKLLSELWKDKRPLRLMGISLTKLEKGAEDEQLSFFQSEQEKKRKRDQKLDKTVDALRERFGSDVIMRGSLMNLDTEVGRKFKGKQASERADNGQYDQSRKNTEV